MLVGFDFEDGVRSLVVLCTLYMEDLYLMLSGYYSYADVLGEGDYHFLL